MLIQKIKIELEILLRKAEKTIQYTDSALKKLPEGRLGVRAKGNRYVLNLNGQQKYLNNKQTDTIRELQQKGYYLDLNAVAKKEAQSLKVILKELENIGKTDFVFYEIPEVRRKYIEPYKEHGKSKIADWIEKNNVRRRVKNTNFKTVRGEFVRSKSELIIADRLNAKGIHYVYEPQLDLVEIDGQWHPDFIVLNKRSGQYFFWEHFGMLDDPEYCNSFQYKMEQYTLAGIVQGRDLIVTTETSERPLNTPYLDAIIEEYLI